MSLPEPYYEDGQSVIYHADAREILPELSGVGLVLTDPPYGIANNGDYTRFSGGQRKSAALRQGRTWEPVTGDSAPFDPLPLLECGDAIIWGANNFAHRLPPGGWIVWAKKSPELVGKFMSDCEVAWCSRGVGVHLYHHVWDGFNRSSERGVFVHPTQKPIALMAWCIMRRPRARTVLDPYMGSGTTLLAAKQLGRKSIGIELEERYCEVAVRRLQQEVLPLEMEPRQHFVQDDLPMEKLP